MSTSSPNNAPSVPPPPPSNETGVQDNWALRVANVSGIPIRIHFSFLLLVLYLAITGIGRGGASTVISLLGLFFCVVLHELGHSLVAQRYGYPVRDITLYPIGGIATIEGSPRPRHELLIAVAGPLVNVVIALLLAGFLAATDGFSAIGYAEARPASATLLLARSPLVSLLYANVMLVLFNLIPAFPMDGGRVLRAALSLRIGQTRATHIAALVGQILAIIMGAYGLGFLGNRPSFGLVLIALFVFFGAGQERRIEETRDEIGDVLVGAAMVRDFQSLQVGDTLRHASEVLVSTSQQDFPVLVGDKEIMGVLSRAQLLRGLAQHGDTAYVAGHMTREPLIAHPADLLETFLLRPDGVNRAPVLVVDDAGTLVGMVTMENVMELLTLRQIERTQRGE